MRLKICIECENGDEHAVTGVAYRMANWSTSAKLDQSRLR
jgi:hypothetical protein